MPTDTRINLQKENNITSIIFLFLTTSVPVLNVQDECMSIKCLFAQMLRFQSCKVLACPLASPRLNSNPNVPIFKVDFHQLSISAEKTLNIFFADMIAQSSNIYTRHVVDDVPEVGTSFHYEPSCDPQPAMSACAVDSSVRNVAIG